MKMKVSQASGPVLDWMVAIAQGQPVRWHPVDRTLYMGDAGDNEYSPTLNWAQGGPIIDRERIGIWPSDSIEDMWVARPDYMVYPERLPPSYATTPLIAAMRCYLTSRLGEEVEVPDEVVEGLK